MDLDLYITHFSKLFYVIITWIRLLNLPINTNSAPSLHCNNQPLDPNDFLSDEIVWRSKKNFALSLTFHTVTTKATLKGRTYFFSIEFVTTIDNHISLSNNLKNWTRSPRTVSFKYVTPLINLKTLAIKIWTQLKLNMQEFRCKTLKIQNREKIFSLKITLKNIIIIIDVMWEIMTKRFYTCLRLSIQKGWKS